MSANDIVNSVFGLIACCILIWLVIKTRKTYTSEDLK